MWYQERLKLSVEGVFLQKTVLESWLGLCGPMEFNICSAEDFLSS